MPTSNSSSTVSNLLSSLDATWNDVVDAATSIYKATVSNQLILLYISCGLGATSVVLMVLLLCAFCCCSKGKRD
jgi:hypothetical protein